ncbi:MAG: hypothetical protein ACOYVK_18410 [Bacillota bacterium]
MVLGNIREKEFKLLDILKSSWFVYWHTIPSIIPIVLIIHLPRNILQSYIAFLTLQSRMRGLNKGLLMLPEAIYLLVFGILPAIAIAFIVKERFDNRVLTFGQALKKAVSRWISGLGTHIIQILILAGLTLLLVIPGLVWLVYYIFAMPVVALKGIGGKTALNYSKSLVKGRWWKTFGLMILFGIFQAIMTKSIQIAFDILLGNVVGDILAAVMVNIVSAYSIVAIVVYFLNLDYLKNRESDFIDNSKDRS